MGGLILSNIFLKFINFFTLVIPLLFLYQSEIDKFFDQKTAVIEKNKQIFLWITFGIVGLINACIQYEKLRFEREKRRELRIDNDIKEKQLKDENTKLDNR